MSAGYVVLPGGVRRPLVDVSINGVLVKGLADTGAVSTIFHAEIAEISGIDISTGTVRILPVGGMRVPTFFHTVPIALGAYEWAAEVGFASEWPESFGLLGHTAFFDFVRATFRSSQGKLHVTPERGVARPRSGAP